MARIDINKIDKVERSSKRHDPVSATYTVFSSNGEKYINLETYGSKERANTDSASQNIQFDKETAAFFVELFKREFNL